MAFRVQGLGLWVQGGFWGSGLRAFSVLGFGVQVGPRDFGV